MKFRNIALLLSVGLAVSAPVKANDDMTTVWTTDFSGKPPFKRQLETIPTADLARFETGTEVVNTTDFSGKPPFKRNVHVLRIVDAARFEIVEESRFVPAPRRFKN